MSPSLWLLYIPFCLAVQTAGRCSGRSSIIAPCLLLGCTAPATHLAPTQPISVLLLGSA